MRFKRKPQPLPLVEIDGVVWCTTHGRTIYEGASQCLLSYSDVDDHGLGEWLECTPVPVYIEGAP